VEAGGDHAFEESELVGVVGVKGGAVDAGGVGDLLDGEALELAGGEELGEGLLEELAGAADARVFEFKRLMVFTRLGRFTRLNGLAGWRLGGRFCRGGEVARDACGEGHGVEIT